MSVQTARLQADRLIDSYHVERAPVDVLSLARQLGLSVIFENLGEGVSGLLVTRAGRGFIVVQKQEKPARQRFTIAHEIGHYVLRHQFDNGRPVHVDRGYLISQRGPRSTTGLDAKEIEANQFAATLLMPVRLLKTALSKLGDPPLSDGVVTELAKIFQVSEQPMTIRLTSLGWL